MPVKVKKLVAVPREQMQFGAIVGMHGIRLLVPMALVRAVSVVHALAIPAIGSAIIRWSLRMAAWVYSLMSSGMTLVCLIYTILLVTPVALKIPLPSGHYIPVGPMEAAAFPLTELVPNPSQ
jgi:hypothetical protein